MKNLLTLDINMINKKRMDETQENPPANLFVAAERNDLGSATVALNENEDCVEAYKNFFCWINFPRCDMDRYVYCRVLDLDSVGCLYVLPPLSFHS